MRASPDSSTWSSAPTVPPEQSAPRSGNADSADGTGCGSDIRVTDIYGETLTDTGIALTPGVEQSGRAQFVKR